MNKKKSVKDIASRLLIDIIRGYSVLNVDGREFYFKHMTLMLSYELDEKYNLYVESAKKSGIKTEEQIIEYSIKNKIWKKEDEDEISSLKWIIEKKQKAKKTMSDKMQIWSLENSIKEDSDKLEQIKNNRKKITEYSAENFAENKKIQFLLDKSVFKNESFTQPAEEEDIQKIIPLFFKKMLEFSDREVLAYAAYDDVFFETFILNHRQPSVIFNKPIFELTIYQKNILMLANSLLNKFKNYSIPDEICDNPLKILQYTDKQETRQGKTTEGIDDLKVKTAAKGGNLNAEDFLS